MHSRVGLLMVSLITGIVLSFCMKRKVTLYTNVYVFTVSEAVVPVASAVSFHENLAPLVRVKLGPRFWPFKTHACLVPFSMLLIT